LAIANIGCVFHLVVFRFFENLVFVLKPVNGRIALGKVNVLNFDRRALGFLRPLVFMKIRLTGAILQVLF
jgi:hypothetical protein